jgi:RIO-like serine/threonine protein kinase
MALEATLREVHARGIVHLDIRNCRNVIVNERNEPVLIDFEAHLDTRGWLRGLREWLERFDLAGVYKHWKRASPETLGPERTAVLEQMNRWRKAWVFRGLWYYPRGLGKLLRRIAGRDGRGERKEHRP